VFKMLTNYINIGFNIESFAHIIVIIIGLLCLIFFLRLDKKRYGLLFILSALAGNIFCYMFVKLNFYSFPYLLFPTITDMPIVVITLSFPIIVLSSVRYSPEKWG
jgi:cytochrome bd-type quinol oxidase subunit 2